MFSKAKIVLCIFLISILAEQCRAAEEDKQSLLPDRNTCGQQKVTGTGKRAELGEYPCTALLKYQNEDGHDAGYRCLACLINNRYLITSAVCVTPEQVNLTEVRLGAYDLAAEKDCKGKGDEACNNRVKDYGVEKKIPHSGYKKREYDNDIALIRLNQTVDFTDNIQPICLPLSDSTHAKPGDTMIATGWGRNVTGDLITIKKRVSSTLITNEECTEEYKKISDKTTITDNHLCTKSSRNNTDFICAGDSGGPLMFLTNDKLQLEGVVSFGVGCGYKYPDVNTKVQNYISWILENIEP